jgi:hypothetical protein
MGKLQSLLTVGFRRDGSGTELSLCHERLANPTYRDAIEGGAWTQALAELEAAL